MSRKILIVFTFITAYAIWGLSSCKKDKIETPFTRIIGIWKKAKYATDDNRNGVIDSKEIFLVESGVKNEIFFREDSTGVETTNSSPALTFKWRIVSGASVLIAYKANDTVTYNISSISAVDLTLTTTNQQGLVWYYYIKE